MNSLPRSKLLGTRLAAVMLSASVLLTSPGVWAQQTEATGLFDNAVLELLIESRSQKPATQATAEERASAVEELTNIYLVSKLPRTIELSQQPQIRAQLDLQEKAILFNAFATDFLANNSPTDQEVFNAYEEQVALAPTTEFNARHILVDTQSAALDLIDELEAGASFVELAKENSTGPSAASGGDLGWFTVQAMVKPFSDAVAVLEDGAFTPEPVQTQFGWHVILREDSRNSPPPPLDSVRDVIKQRIAQQKFQEFVNSLRSTASE